MGDGDPFDSNAPIWAAAGATAIRNLDFTNNVKSDKMRKRLHNYQIMTPSSPSPGRVSIKDIARKANVAPSTVSRALHDHPRISLATRQQIQGLAEAMGYVPSEVARALVGRRATTIGVAVPEIDDPFYTGIISGIEQVAVAHEYDFFVGSFNRDRQRERKLFDAFEEKRLAGIVIAGTSVDDAYLNRERQPLPAVLVSQPGYPFAVDIDQEQGSHLAIQHLAGLGHQRIAYIGLRNDTASQRRRFAGYQAALEHAGLTFNPTYVALGDGRIQGGVAAMQQLLQVSNRPTAVFCYNDRMAIGASHAVHAASLRVPQDVSIVGFDDLEIAAYVNPPLTTVRQPNIELGRRAAEMLFAQINHQPVSPQLLTPELIVRQSTDQQSGTL